jgi:chromosome segregation ATPase
MKRFGYMAVCCLLVFTNAAMAAKKGGGGKGGQTAPAAGQQQTTGTQSATDQAHADLDAAQTALNTLVDKLTKAFMDTDDYRAAQKDLDSALDAYEKAHAAAFAALKTQPNYKAAVASEKAARKTLDDLKAAPVPDANQISEATDDLTTKSDAVDHLEADALAADPAVQTTHAALQAARDKLASLKAAFKDGLKSNKDYLAAQQAVTDAQAKLTAQAAKN